MPYALANILLTMWGAFVVILRSGLGEDQQVVFGGAY